MEIGPQGRITWTPTEDQLGVAPVVVEVSDGRGGTDTQRFEILVQETGNVRPRFESLPPRTVVAGELYRYDPEVTDPEDDPLTFELVQAPAGMAVDRTGGTTVWVPVGSQVGDHNVLLRVGDDHDNSDVQSFTITVEQGNTPPMILSQPVTEAVVDLPYSYQALALDGDGDELAFGLADGPEGMTIDPATGLVRFTAEADQVGSHTVIVTVSDGRGGTASQVYELAVVETAANRQPTITSQPRVVTGLGQLYVYQLTVVDPDGDPLAYVLDEAPAGMQIDAGGAIDWQPAADQLGDHAVSVRVLDGRGGEDTQDFVLRVVSEPTNDAPVIVSNPRLVAIAGELYAYDAVAVDPDHDPVFWSLDQAPDGMAIDLETGRVRWTPNQDQLGPHNVTLRAEDPFLAGDIQSFTVEVRSSNLPPIVTTTPETTAFVDENYRYHVGAEDPDGDALTFTLAEAPAGMTIDTQSGLIQWQPTPDDVGLHVVHVQVTDTSGGETEQVYPVTVEAQRPNEPPVITSAPVLSATLEDPYTYQVTAFDPDNDTVAFELVEGPVGMVIDTASGLITWTPLVDQAGVHTVTVAAVDAHDGRGTQSYAVIAEVNNAPQIVSEPLETVAAGALYLYDVNAEDPEGDRLSFELIAAPEGMAIDAFGRIEWQSGLSDLGSHLVSVRVTDTHGASDTQTFDLTVNADTDPPNVQIGFPTNLFRLGDAALFQVLATDDIGVETVSLRLGDAELALGSPDASGIRLSEVVFTQSGVFELIATATDAAGNVGTAQVEIQVVDPADINPPRVDILRLVSDDVTTVIIDETGTQVADSAVVTYLTEVFATIDDDGVIAKYTIDYAPVGAVDLNDIAGNDPDWIQIDDGTESVTNSRVATFDPTSLANDQYVLRIVAHDDGGNASAHAVFISVEGNAKLGQFSLEFTDLSIPLAGIPIQITRRYDSFQSTDEGDFGFGWSLGVQDADIAEAGARGARGALRGGGSGINDTFVPDVTRVYLTDPAGQRIGFTYKEELTSASLFGGLWRPFFEPDPGITSALTIDETQVARGGIIGALAQGINPNRYTLTTADGTAYVYDQVAGLQDITDLNGNQVTFTDNGVFHSSGESIQFIRDPQGRIKQIIDPDGNTVTYGYDAAGDLVSVTDQEDLTTQFTYLDTPAHFLDEVIDPLGRMASKTEYDENGRVRAVIDAQGNRVVQEFDPGFFTGTITDANGNITNLVYDERGNIIREIDPDNNTTFREYTDPAKPDLETRIIDRRGFVTDRKYDDRGNVLEILETGHVDDPFDQPLKTAFTYNGLDQVTSITNARNQLTTFIYDDRGNLEQIINAEANSAFFTYDDQGRRETFTDFNANTTTFAYTTGDQPTRVTFADDTYQEFAYNAYGQVTREAFYEADGTLVEQRETRYDRLGRVTEEIAGIAPGSSDSHPQTIVRRFYDAHLLDYEAIVHPDSLDDDTGLLLESPATPIDDRFSRITDFEYDAADRLIRQTDPEGGVVEFRYDPNGNRVLLQDPVGNITTWVYDALDRVIEERDPFYWENVRASDPVLAALPNDEFLQRIAPIDPATNPDPLYDDPSGADCATLTGADHVTLSCYDEEGNLALTIDRNGRRREFDYDHAGRLIEEQWFTSEASGGDLVRTIEFTYDAVGNMLTATDPDSTYTFAYDALNRLHTVDNAGTPGAPNVVLIYRYDAQGNVVLTQDNAGVTVESQYDPRNRLEWRKWFDADIPTSETADVDPARVDFLYNAAGREALVSRFADLDATQLVSTTTRTYDTAGRSDLLTHHNATGDLLAGYDYDYDFSGLLTHEARTHQDAQFAQVVDYVYDLTGQLIDALFSGQDDEHYVYDANGNRLSSTVGTDERTYTTGLANQLETDGQFRYEYDGEGNQIKRIDLTTGETRTFEYDHRNRLMRIDDWSSDPGDPNNPTPGAILTQSVDYTYDLFGHRIARNVDADGQGPQTTETIWFVYNGDNVWADFDQAGEVIARYLFGNRIDNNIARFRPDGGSVWYLVDKLGTVQDIADASGSVANHDSFDSYGNLLHQTNVSISDRFAFQGREFNLETGDYYYRARQYDPLRGVFLSHDPLRFTSGDLNLYRFVANDPTNRTDPTGKIAFTEYAVENATAGFLLTAFANSVDLAVKIATCGPDSVSGRQVFIDLLVKPLSVGFIALFLGGFVRPEVSTIFGGPPTLVLPKNVLAGIAAAGGSQVGITAVDCATQ